MQGSIEALRIGTPSGPQREGMVVCHELQFAPHERATIVANGRSWTGHEGDFRPKAYLDICYIGSRDGHVYPSTGQGVTVFHGHPGTLEVQKQRDFQACRDCGRAGGWRSEYKNSISPTEATRSGMRGRLRGNKIFAKPSHKTWVGSITTGLSLPRDRRSTG